MLPIYSIFGAAAVPLALIATNALRGLDEPFQIYKGLCSHC